MTVRSNCLLGANARTLATILLNPRTAYSAVQLIRLDLKPKVNGMPIRRMRYLNVIARDSTYSYVTQAVGASDMYVELGRINRDYPCLAL
jgi:hypothetical protein